MSREVMNRDKMDEDGRMTQGSPMCTRRKSKGYAERRKHPFFHAMDMSVLLEAPSPIR